MIEFTFAELALFVWGMGATAIALKYKQEADMAKFIIKQLVTDEEVRNKIVGAYEEHKESA
jgi:hypothetical protein